MSYLRDLIIKRRRELGITQAQLAIRVGCAAATIEGIERPDPYCRDTTRLYTKIARALGLEPSVVEDAMGLDSSLRSWLKGQPEVIRFIRRLRRGETKLP